MTTRAALAAALALGPAFAGAQELVMFDAPGCYWCAKWTEEIGPIYPKTAEGERAPLRRVSIAAPMPADLPEIGRIVYTPTFVLVHDGAEIGRIEGYPGEDFFWGLLTRLVDELPRTPNNNEGEG
ncbi:hypothetical protein HMH01_02235 [Halovulum dunhuangense]|uniref:Thioredoxin-like protein n=1 Tax=Halovulum dunhuangense TaxID=1505036 RepID=A0A849KYI2_9RHOB|nr:hypothetical protein [Halovulum dunhuangense]NNU79246.1 hypothetical protein [Halovulum dunhuangense]